MKNKNITFDELEKASKVWGLIGLENKEMIKKRYLELSKKFHPDMNDGDTQKFQEINSAYKVVDKYISNYKFSMTKEEFVDQYPYAFVDNQNWFKKRH